MCSSDLDGSLELDSADKFYISNEENLELQIGDLVEISYNGEIMESYPAQLGEVYEMHLAAMQGVFLLQKVHLHITCRSCIFANCML